MPSTQRPAETRDEESDIVAKRKRYENKDSSRTKQPPAYIPGPPILSNYSPYGSGQINIQFQQNHAQNWDTYYRNNTTNGYKDRHYIHREFPELKAALDAQQEAEKASGDGQSSDKLELLEIGCGVGNTFFPLLEQFPSKNFVAYGFDISKVAIDLLVADAAKRGLQSRVKATVCDLATQDVPEGFMPNGMTVQFASLVFVLCSVDLSRHELFMKRAANTLTKGGILFFRDYCKDDLAMKRFAASNHGVQDESDATFARSNGTLSHFFETEEVLELFKKVGLECIEIRVESREVENRRQGSSMSRRWIQARFRRV